MFHVKHPVRFFNNESHRQPGEGLPGADLGDVSLLVRRREETKRGKEKRRCLQPLNDGVARRAIS